jgi:putative membrane protein
MTKVQRWSQVIILGATGLYFTYNLASGNITNYISNKFIWLSWIAAGLLLVLSVISAATLIGQPNPARDEPHAHDHSHHDSHGSAGRLRTWLGLGIVMLPVMLGVLVPSRPLGSRAVDGQVASDLSSINASASARIDIAPLDRNVLEWLRVFGTDADPSVLNSQEADVVGFVYRDIHFDRATQFMVTRFIVSCCVADAQAIGLIVEWPQANTLHEDSWVRVRGKFEAREFNGVLSPWLIADEGQQGVQPVDQPENPYLYP